MPVAESGHAKVGAFNVEHANLVALSVETCTAQHIGDRKEQQDRVALFPHPNRRGMFMAVLADGMGGHTGGAMAAEQVVLKAQQNFEDYGPADESAEQLLGSIISESHVVIKLTRFTSEQDPHTTACVLLFQAGRVDWAHCGDSRIYHFRGDKLVSRTSDHSYVNEMVKQGFLTPEQADQHPQKNVLLGCLGSEREPTIDFRRHDAAGRRRHLPACARTASGPTSRMPNWAACCPPIRRGRRRKSSSSARATAPTATATTARW